MYTLILNINDIEKKLFAIPLTQRSNKFVDLIECLIHIRCCKSYRGNQGALNESEECNS